MMWRASLMNLKVLDSTDPLNSLLYTKVTDAPPCGGQMPFGQPPLSASDVECIRSWVLDNAAQ